VVRDCAQYPELHPHLDWFTSLRGRLDAVFADYGCQGIPRLGRLVFTEQRENIIHPAVSARFGSLRAATQQDLKDEMEQFALVSDAAPAVHVAASVCGGTGAGMLIDMANCVVVEESFHYRLRSSALNARRRLSSIRSCGRSCRRGRGDSNRSSS
jgi:hypothetical protein